jgi:type II secretory pathway pseudopilin PulG
MKRFAKIERLRAFSLVEVTIALGVIAISLVAVIGLLPTGLVTQQQAQDETRAASALNLVSSAVESLRRTNAGQGKPTWAFPSYFTDNPAGSPMIVWVGQETWNFTFFVDEGGLIIPTNDTTTTKRQTLYVKVYPPQALGDAVGIYAAVAWPYRPTDTNALTPDQMKGRQGFIDNFLAYTPSSSF